MQTTSREREDRQRVLEEEEDACCRERDDRQMVLEEEDACLRQANTIPQSIKMHPAS